MHVLIVDDNPHLLEMFEMLVCDSGHRSTVASSGDDACALLEVETPDVIVTDLLMPDGGGMKVIAEAVRRGIPYIVVTGHSDAYERLVPAGATVLQKASGDDFDLIAAITAAAGDRRELA